MEHVTVEFPRRETPAETRPVRVLSGKAKSVAAKPAEAKPNESRPDEAKSVVIRLHLWLETEAGVAFGLGRLLLLETLAKEGSLKSAAEAMGMSYRAAWGKLKTTEQALGQQLVEKTKGSRGGLRLTPYGLELVRRFRHWFDAVESEALDKARALFPFSLCGYPNRGRK